MMLSHHFPKIFQGYCIHLPYMKRIHLMAAKLLKKENANPAESLLPYPNKGAVAGFLPTTESNLRTALGVEICKLGIIACKSRDGYLL